MKKVESGKTISVHYTGKFDNGEVEENVIPTKPLSMKVGGGFLLDFFNLIDPPYTPKRGGRVDAVKGLSILQHIL